MCLSSNRTLRNSFDGVHLFTGLRCNSWDCEECGPRKQRALIARVIAGRPNKHLILTSKHRVESSPEAAARALVVAWRNIRQWFARHGKRERIEFLAIFERCEDGWPHLHIALRSGYLPQALLSRLLEKYTGAKIVWISRIETPEAVAAYISKYVSKAPARWSGIRSFWSSKHFCEKLDYERPVLDRCDVEPYGIDRCWENALVTHDELFWLEEYQFIAAPHGFRNAGWRVPP